jgi:catechol 2,3-dioxygenase-like lactoylglutathione lyase family enzyme
MARGAFLLGLLVAALSLTSAPALAAESGAGCPNEQLRTSFSAALPDCRAYEYVSAPGSEPFFGTFGQVENVTANSTNLGNTRNARASIDGNRFVYLSSSAPPGAPSDGPFYLSTRTATGWSTEDLIPPGSVRNSFVCESSYIAGFSSDISKVVLADGWGQGPEAGGFEDCGHDEPLLVQGEPEGVQNLFVRNNDTDAYELVDPVPLAGAPTDAEFQAASADLSHVVFEDGAQLTPEAPPVAAVPAADGQIQAGQDLYEWAGGVIRLVTILPNGTPTHGTLVDRHIYTASSGGEGLEEDTSYPNYHGGLSPVMTNAVSEDGSHIFFYDRNGNLYERIHADQEQSPIDSEGHCANPALACTVEVDASQGTGPGGGGVFMRASADGSKVFFMDRDAAGLTSNTVSGSGQNLYEYDLETGKLTDLTAANDANALGVAGISENGAYVYFVAEGALTGNANSVGNKAVAGQGNLYLAHAGTITFIASLVVSPGEEFGKEGELDDCDWRVFCLTSKVSPNGTFIGFNSVGSPTGYDNTDLHSGKVDQEIYLYEAAQDRLRCLSCDPSGAQPVAPAGFRIITADALGTNDELQPSLARNVLDDGRVFFDTTEPLVPSAAIGASHVYEYENGQLHLISSASGSDAYFFDASSSGDDVFFATGQRMLAGDTAAVSLYDARVDGGIPESGSPTACSEEDCKGALSPTPLFGPPSSATFVGPGNQPSPPPPAKKAKVKAAPTRAQKLAAALKACRKQPKRKRAACERKARKANKSSRRSK